MHSSQVNGKDYTWKNLHMLIEMVVAFSSTRIARYIGSVSRTQSEKPNLGMNSPPFRRGVNHSLSVFHPITNFVSTQVASEEVPMPKR